MTETCKISGCSKPVRAKELCSTCYSRVNYKKKPGHRGTLEERFWKKVVKGCEPSDCWGWSGSTSPAGYGAIWPGPGSNGPTQAHRVSYEIHKGNIPAGLLIMHICDNPPCCNPDHLEIGTDKTNAEDKAKKLRHNFGEQRYNAKLTEKDVIEIRASVGVTQSQLAKNYKVTGSVISNIINRKTWKHV